MDPQGNNASRVNSGGGGGPILMGADNLPTVGPNIQLMMNEQEVVRKAGRQAINEFLNSHNCFSVLRASGKVVVFDTRIPIQLAFYALVEHGKKI